MSEALSITAPFCNYGIWTDYRIPDDRSGWHPMVRQFYEYWLAVAPPGQLPGRQHIAAEDLASLLPRLWLCDVYRDPLRLRYRLVGTEVAWSLGGEVTGRWLDEVQPEGFQKQYDRYRFMVETGRPTWRRGTTNLERDPRHHSVENCHVPLARDGRTVDMIFAVSVLFDYAGHELHRAG